MDVEDYNFVTVTPPLVGGEVYKPNDIRKEEPFDIIKVESSIDKFVINQADKEKYSLFKLIAKRNEDYRVFFWANNQVLTSKKIKNQ